MDMIGKFNEMLGEVDDSAALQSMQNQLLGIQYDRTSAAQKLGEFQAFLSDNQDMLKQLTNGDDDSLKIAWP